MRHYRSFRLAFGLALVALAPVQVFAQTGTGVTLPGTSATPAGSQTCVQVEIAGQKPSTYNCLNQELQQEVQGSGKATPKTPLSATSPSNQVGTFNREGVVEQYGQNFGKSVIPYRPPPPVFNNSLGPAH